MNEQKDKYIQEQRNKIRDKETRKALKDAATFTPEVVKFERPHEDKMPDQIGGMNTKGFHVEKGEEKNTAHNAPKHNPNKKVSNKLMTLLL